MSASKRTLRSPSSDCFSQSSIAAILARCGHSPPAVSAMRKSSRHTSACRSESAGSISGSCASIFSALSSVQRATLEASGAKSWSRSLLSRSICSSSSLRRIRIMTDRLSMVSGRLPIKAIAFGAYTLNRRGSLSSPTMRATCAAVLVKPALVNVLSSSFCLNIASASSIKRVGVSISTHLNNAATLMLATLSGFGTRRLTTSNAVLLPQAFTAEENTRFGQTLAFCAICAKTIQSVIASIFTALATMKRRTCVATSLRSFTPSCGSLAGTGSGKLNARPCFSCSCEGFLRNASSAEARMFARFAISLRLRSYSMLSSCGIRESAFSSLPFLRRANISCKSVCSKVVELPLIESSTESLLCSKVASLSVPFVAFSKVSSAIRCRSRYMSAIYASPNRKRLVPQESIEIFKVCRSCCILGTEKEPRENFGKQ